MSEDNKITKVEKLKDPRKVEAGKRLGAISRCAKEKAEARDAAIFTESASSMDLKGLGLVVGVVGIVVGVTGLYYKFNGKSDCVNVSSDDHTDRKTPLDENSEFKTETNPKTKLDTLD